MTCIVGLIDNDGTVYMGADSASINDATGLKCVRKSGKIFNKNGFVIGLTGTCRHLDVLQYSFKPPFHDDDMDVLLYLNTLFIDALRNEFKRAGICESIDPDDSGCGILMIYKNRLFFITSGYSVDEYITKYHATGTGAQVALGSLYSTSHLESFDRVTMALNAASKHIMGIEPPYDIISVNGYLTQHFKEFSPMLNKV